MYGIQSCFLEKISFYYTFINIFSLFYTLLTYGRGEVDLDGVLILSKLRTRSHEATVIFGGEHVLAQLIGSYRLYVINCNVNG